MSGKPSSRKRGGAKARKASVLRPLRLYRATSLGAAVAMGAQAIAEIVKARERSAFPLRRVKP